MLIDIIIEVLVFILIALVIGIPFAWIYWRIFLWRTKKKIRKLNKLEGIKNEEIKEEITRTATDTTERRTPETPSSFNRTAGNAVGQGWSFPIQSSWNFGKVGGIDGKTNSSYGRKKRNSKRRY